MDVAEAGGVDMGVDLGRPDVGVSEKFLDGADVRAVREHVRGEAMAKDMRRNAVRGDSDRGGPGTDDLEDALTRERLPEPREEDMVLGEIAAGERFAGSLEVGRERPHHAAISFPACR